MQRSIDKKLQKTAVIALLQPTPEVFELSDDVIILNEGEVMYHGLSVVSHYDSLRFKCPTERDIANYLLDLETNRQYKYEAALPGWCTTLGWRASCDVLAALEGPYDTKLLENVRNDADTMLNTAFLKGRHEVLLALLHFNHERFSVLSGH
ncbi:LOW QUALITY PROTEIN: ABC transporter [Phytophthora megakarya]|uniref:ABC transporter n=1 Tax=Phytophthora megakarya TaxID=4795 RepID=A0A225VJM7_9STRA|nr:LOW QUALITY PROTEIN: ABC transporter [Phytophthora megakarya]